MYSARVNTPGSSGLPWRAAALVAVAALSIGVVAAVVWPRREAPLAYAGPAAPCPAGFFDQLGRAQTLQAALRSTDEGRALLDELGATEVRWCFGAIEVPVVQDDRVLVLDRGMDDAELAPRAGHLLHHVVRGAPFPASVERDADCDRVVHEALEREARAYALELRLRRALSVETARYEFEAAYFAADASEGDRVIFDYLLSHPQGGPGIDGLAAAYRQRCDVERARDRSAR